jgi:hypothetical protein
VVARNEAVRQVNHHLWLKGFFEKHAMGLVGDLPKIAY